MMVDAIQPVRILVADDSATVRATISRLIAREGGLLVVGEARDGLEVVRLAKSLRPDVITMDVQMPGLDGLEATAAIMASAPTRIVLVCTLDVEDGAEMSFRALAAGALEVVAKPGPLAGHGPERWGARLVETVRLMAEVPVITRFRGARLPETRPVEPREPRSVRACAAQCPVVAIAASTGGPPALARILGDLPRDFPAAVLVAQHMARGFVDGLVRWLRTTSALPIELVTGEARLAPQRVYLPADGGDLVLADGETVRWVRSQGGVCPNADVLMESTARVAGAGAAGLVLTGMGEDGVRGLAAMRRADAWTAAQDERSSVVYGMPRAAMLSGAARREIPLDRAAAELVAAVAWLVQREARPFPLESDR